MVYYQDDSEAIVNGQKYEFEYLVDPIIVFYTTDLEYTRKLIKILKYSFPDSKTESMTAGIDYYPRFNIKINNMVYVSIGNSNDKMDKNKCVNNNGKLICEPDQLPPLPLEYKEIQEKCGLEKNENRCHILNSIPSKISKHSLCQWKENECKPRRTLSSHYLIGDKKSIRNVYEELDQIEVFKKTATQELQKDESSFPFKRSHEIFSRWNGSSRKKRISKRKTRRVKK